MLRELRARAETLDREDRLSHYRGRFALPASGIYLCGNSLGAKPAGIENRIARAVAHEWADGLVQSWNSAGWIDLPRLAAARIARLIGADQECVAVTDSTSINLFKVLAAAMKLNPRRRMILSERDNFPTDLYIAEGLIRLLGKRHELVLVDRPEALETAIDEDTAVIVLSHVNYRTGHMLDMHRLTEAAHAVGALIIWDLAHSAGAVEVDLDECGVDFAVGCGYKFLNGGPGAPAFLYAAERHLGDAEQPLSGWFSHRAPFAFDPAYEPAEGIDRFYTGTPAVLSLIALNEALEVWRDADMAVVRAKSLALTNLFIEALDQSGPGLGLKLVTPRDPTLRGSQVSLAIHENGYAVMRALIASGVIGDFRAPDILRFGFAPLYNRHVDVVDAMGALADILRHRSWDRPEFHRHEKVT